MQNISYMNAIGSCLPVVGGVVFGILTGRLNEADQDRLIIATAQNVITHIRIAIENARRSQDVSDLDAKVSDQEVLVQNLKDLSIKKTRIYSICGIISNVLTIALVAKVASGIFAILAVPVAVICTFGLIGHSITCLYAAEDLERSLPHYRNALLARQPT